MVRNRRVSSESGWGGWLVAQQSQQCPVPGRCCYRTRVTAALGEETEGKGLGGKGEGWEGSYYGLQLTPDFNPRPSELLTPRCLSGMGTHPAQHPLQLSDPQSEGLLLLFRRRSAERQAPPARQTVSVDSERHGFSVTAEVRAVAPVFWHAE